MNSNTFRRIALSMPGSAEGSHMEHADFRVGGKIFASLWPDDEWGMVKLTPDLQEEFVEERPEVFSPVAGGWGRQGCTRVRLDAADAAAVRRAMLAAWRLRAPKSVLEAADSKSGTRNRSASRKAGEGGGRKGGR